MTRVKDQPSDALDVVKSCLLSKSELDTSLNNNNNLSGIISIALGISKLKQPQ